jgi:hypothetical protein
MTDLWRRSPNDIAVTVGSCCRARTTTISSGSSRGFSLECAWF